MSKFKPIPKFQSEDDVREFWATHDTTDYVNWDKALVNPSMPNLKPSTETISLRLSQSLLDRIRAEARKHDVPYQSLMKLMLADYFKRDQKAI